MAEIQIKHPWIILHQPGGDADKMECLLAGPEGATWEHFAVGIADVIRHLARAFTQRGTLVDEFEILSLIEREIENPTTTITGQTRT